MCECKGCKQMKEQMENLALQVGKSSSHAFNAEVSAVQAASTVGTMEKALYQFHNDDEKTRELMWKEIKEIKSFKSQMIGIAIGVAMLFTAIINGLGWVISTSWDKLFKLVH